MTKQTDNDFNETMYYISKTLDSIINSLEKHTTIITNLLLRIEKIENQQRNKNMN